MVAKAEVVSVKLGDDGGESGGFGTAAFTSKVGVVASMAGVVAENVR